MGADKGRNVYIDSRPLASGTLEEDLEFHIYFLSYYISVPVGVIFQKEW